MKLLRGLPIAALALVLAPGATPGRGADSGYTHVEIADCHVHLLDFLQNGDFYADGKFLRGGTPNQPQHPGQRIEALLRMMDYAHVSQALVMGMPFVKKWSANDPARGRYYLDTGSPVTLARETDYTIAEAILDYRKRGGDPAQLRRLHPFVCGFDATDLGSVDRITKTIKLFPGVFQGIGEVMSRHDDLTNLTTADRPSADHPALRRIHDFAGIHHNIAPISPSGAYTRPAYLKELLTCFEGHPKTKFIWCHAGISRRIVVKDLETWVALIKKYPGNFMLGSDIVGNLRPYVSTIRAHDRLLGALGDEALARQIASENFQRLMPATGVTLPADYLYPEDGYLPHSPNVPRP